MQFTQHIVLYSADEEGLVRHVRDWQENHAPKVPGFLGTRLFRFREKEGRYVVEANFASWQDAKTNNDRPETQAWAAGLLELTDGQPKYENLDVMIESDT